MQFRHLTIRAEHRVGDGRSSGGGGQRRRAPARPASPSSIWSTGRCTKRVTQLPALPLLLLLLLQLLLQGGQLALQLVPLSVRLRQLTLHCVEKDRRDGGVM